MKREIKSVRSVRHTALSSNKFAHEAGLKLTYAAPIGPGGVGGTVEGSLSFDFNYARTTTSSAANGEQVVNIFKVQEKKTLPPKSGKDLSDNNTENISRLQRRTVPIK